jgi:hypothetical protein
MNGRSDCAAFHEQLVEAAYGELSGPAMDSLAAHVATCDTCRQESESLRATRRALRAALAAPPPDASATLVVMPRAPRITPRWGRLAAAAAVLALVAVAFSRAEVAVGAGGTTVSFRLRRGGPETPPEIETASSAVLAALRELRSRDLNSREALPRALAEEFDRRSVAIRESQDAALARLIDEIDRRRAQDLGFVLSQMGSLEQRTGVEMARTQQLLQYAMLSQPGDVDSAR